MKIENGTVVCDECGTTLVEVRSGYVCPNGHGKIVPAAQLPSKAELLKAAIASLPKATLLQCRGVFGNRNVYSIEGFPGVYRLLSANVSVQYLCVGESFKARYCGEYVGVFERFAELEDACREIMGLQETHQC
jgi:hypothetical protein